MNISHVLLLVLLAFGWLYVLRRVHYRWYLRSPGWWLTKVLRKRGKCERCGDRKRLHLHHVEYDWHNRHEMLRFVTPNMSDRMQTLCARHHAEAHGK
jgi:hypothetical protein